MFLGWGHLGFCHKICKIQFHCVWQFARANFPPKTVCVVLLFPRAETRTTDI